MPSTMQQTHLLNFNPSQQNLMLSSKEQMPTEDSERSDEDSIDEMISKQVEETAGVIVSAKEICQFSPRDYELHSVHNFHRNSLKA